MGGVSTADDAAAALAERPCPSCGGRFKTGTGVAGVIAQMNAMLLGACDIPVSVPGNLSALLRAGLAPRPEARPSASELFAALCAGGYASQPSSGDDDPNQRDEYERELAKLERTRGIRPSKLVK